MKHHVDQLEHLCKLFSEESAKTTKKSKVEARNLLMLISKHCQACRKEILNSYSKKKSK